MYRKAYIENISILVSETSCVPAYLDRNYQVHSINYTTDRTGDVYLPTFRMILSAWNVNKNPIWGVNYVPVNEKLEYAFAVII